MATLTVTPKPPVDANGNLTVSSNAGFTLAVSFQDVTGALIDVTERTLAFYVPSRIHKQLYQVTGSPSTRLLALSAPELQRIAPYSPLSFDFRDETCVDADGNTLVVTFWAGTLTINGS